MTELTPEQAAAVAELTPEQIAAIGKAGPAVQEAITTSTSEADARSKTEQAVKDNVEGISDDDAKKVANFTIDALKQAGAFDEPAAPAPEPEPVPPAAPAPAPGETVADAAPPAPPAPPAPVEEPRKTTFAERYLGGA